MSIRLIDHMIHLKLTLTSRKRHGSGVLGAANNSWCGLFSAPLPVLRFAGPLGPSPDFNSNPLGRICSALP
jgi:hypothetical protein